MSLFGTKTSARLDDIERHAAYWEFRDILNAAPSANGDSELSEVSHALTALAGTSIIRMQIEACPAAHARFMLLQGCGSERSIREGIRMLAELREDVARAEETMEAFGSRSKHLKSVRDLVVRLRRQLGYRQQELLLAGVEMTDVDPGMTFDPKFHNATDQIDTDDESLVGQIAGSVTPVFRWRDEQDVEQCVPAQVTLYRLASTGEAA